MAFLEVKNLTFRYDSGGGIEGVTFSLHQGDKLAVIGSNGAGKTTLLLCIAGLVKFDGEIVFEGKIFNYRSSSELRKQMGFVFQDPDDQIFMPTVFEEVAFVLRMRKAGEEEIKEKVKRALSSVGLQGFENREPHHLSFGEKRRLCIASAIVHSPKLLFLDEPTSGLDPRGKRELEALLKGMKETVIIATHDLSFARAICNRALLLKEGKAVFFGTVEELLSKRELLEKCHVV